MKTYKIGMIGFGYFGRILFRYFEAHKGFKIKSIATRHPDLLKDEIPDSVKTCFTQQILDDKDIEAVIIATPIKTHEQFIQLSLTHNKHIFVEKPLGIDYEKSYNLAIQARRKGLCLFTDYTLTFSPGIRKMISLVKEGTIGEVKAAVFNIQKLGHFSENSVYIDLGCHILSVLDLMTSLNDLSFFADDIVVRDGIVETGIINFKSRIPDENPLKGSIFLSFNYPHKTRNITFYGEAGTIVYDIAGPKTLVLEKYKVDRGISRDPLNRERFEFEFDEYNTLKEVVDGFYRVLNGEIDSNIEMSLRITKALEKITCS